MGEERLIEIAKEICKTNDPIWTMGYIASLSSSDIYILFKYIMSSKYYGTANMYEVIYKFALDYLISNGIQVKVSNVDFSVSGTSFGNLLPIDYLDKMIASDDSTKTVSTGRRK